MLEEAVDAEFSSPRISSAKVCPACPMADTRTYLEFVADQRLSQLGLPKRFNASNLFAFMELQDVQELPNFFERTVRPTRSVSRAMLPRRGLLSPTLSPPESPPTTSPDTKRAHPQTAASLTNGAAVLRPSSPERGSRHLVERITRRHAGTSTVGVSS